MKRYRRLRHFEIKYLPNEEIHRRTLTRQLDSMTVNEMIDPNIFSADIWDHRFKIEGIGELVPKINIKNVIMTALTRL